MIEGVLFIVFGLIGIIQYLGCIVHVDALRNSLYFRVVCGAGYNFLSIFSLLLFIMGVMCIVRVKKGIIEEATDRGTLITIVVVYFICLIMSIF